MSSTRKNVGRLVERHLNKHARPGFSCFVCRSRKFKFLGVSGADSAVLILPTMDEHKELLTDELEVKLACERCGWVFSFWAPAIEELKEIANIDAALSVRLK